MTAFWSYAATLLVYLGVNTIACWGLNLQFGVGGVMNFAFILFQAMGAYITAVLTLPRSTTGSAETYILGWHLPWPLPLAGAAVAGAVLAWLSGRSRCGRSGGTSRPRSCWSSPSSPRPWW